MAKRYPPHIWGISKYLCFRFCLFVCLFQIVFKMFQIFAFFFLEISANVLCFFPKYFLQPTKTFWWPKQRVGYNCHFEHQLGSKGKLIFYKLSVYKCCLSYFLFHFQRGGSSMKDYLSEIFLLMALLTLFLLFVVTCADAVALKFYRLMGLLIWLSLMVAIYIVYALHLKPDVFPVGDLGLIIFTILTLYMMLPLSTKGAILAGWTTCIPHIILMFAGEFWIPANQLSNGTDSSQNQSIPEPEPEPSSTTQGCASNVRTTQSKSVFFPSFLSLKVRFKVWRQKTCGSLYTIYIYTI